MIFLDVGAHEGQTLEEVVRHDFDLIYAFEPMPRQFAALCERFADHPRVVLCDYGLEGFTGSARLFGTNEQMEASIFDCKLGVDPDVVTDCDFVEASEFFRALPPEQRVVAKLNCEGSEVAILENLLDTGEIWKLENVMVDFDIRKVRGREHQEQELMDRLAGAGFAKLHLAEDVMFSRDATGAVIVGAENTHQERIAHWLGEIG